MTARIVFLLTVLAIVLLALVLAIHVGRKAELEVESHGSEVGLVIPGPALEPTTTTAKPAPTTTTVKAVVRSASVRPPVVYGTGACGGDLPPCWVMKRESGGNINAYNPTGCSGRGCYGKWQCDPRTCDGTGTEEEQDAEARRVWDNGRGCSHWAAC